MRGATVQNKICFLKSLISACCSYGSVSSSRTIKNSRLVSQKDDVHVCIMCLRAIMNYQVLVMAVEDWRRAHTHTWDACVYLHVLRCLLTTSCSVLLFFTQYGFNMVMSHAHAVNEIALSLNNKNSRWELRPSVPREAGLGRTMGETLQPVHLIGLYFFMRFSFSLKSEIRGAHAGCSRNVY